MAKRSQRAARPQTGATMPSRRRSRSPYRQAADDACFVTSGSRDGGFGFRLDAVGEIVRLPSLAHMPLAPRSLLGLANLRGVVLPVVSLRRLLGLPERTGRR